MSSIYTMEITEPPKFKTPKNILKSVSEYQKRNPEKCAEKKHEIIIEGLKLTQKDTQNI